MCYVHLTSLVFYQNCKMKQEFDVPVCDWASSGLTRFNPVESGFETQRGDLVENERVKVKVIVQRGVIKTGIVTGVR